MDVGLSNARHHCAAHDLKINKRGTAQDEKKNALNCNINNDIWKYEPDFQNC